MLARIIRHAPGSVLCDPRATTNGTKNTLSLWRVANIVAIEFSVGSKTTRDVNAQMRIVHIY